MKAIKSIAGEEIESLFSGKTTVTEQKMHEIVTKIKTMSPEDKINNSLTVAYVLLSLSGCGWANSYISTVVDTYYNLQKVKSGYLPEADQIPDTLDNISDLLQGDTEQQIYASSMLLSKLSGMFAKNGLGKVFDSNIEKATNRLQDLKDRISDYKVYN